MENITKSARDLAENKNFLDQRQSTKILERVQLRYDTEVLSDDVHLTKNHTQLDSHTEHTSHTNSGGK